MSRTRIYQATSLSPRTIIRLSENAGHHLARVLRMKIGDEITVFDGTGGEYEALITSINKKGVDVELSQFIAREAESEIEIELAQGIAKGDKMDFIVQKSVELGVKKITPLLTERCNVRLDKNREEKRMQHWQSVIISACEQCGRNRLPTIADASTLASWLETVQADHRFVLSPHEPGKLPKSKIEARSSVSLLIGPEGGLSEAEVMLAKKHGFAPLNLGPRVLRTETATIAAIAAIELCLTTQ